MSSLGKGYKMHLKVVWNRVGVENFQRHTPTQKYSECPPPRDYDEDFKTFKSKLFYEIDHP